MKGDIIDYMGFYEGGVMVLITITLNEKVWESTLWYSNEKVVLTPPLELERELGMEIEFHEDYKDLLIDLFNKLTPIENLNLSEVKFSNYLENKNKDKIIIEEINPEKIISKTFSNNF